MAIIKEDLQDDLHAQTGVDQGTSSTVGFHATHHNDLARLTNRDPFKPSCKWATTASFTPTATTSTTLTTGLAAWSPDGTAVANDDRVFVKNQTGAATWQNGIYVVSGVGSDIVLTRASDADVALLLADALVVAVERGTVNRDSIWELTTDNPITVGTTPMRFTRVHPSYRNASKPAGSEFMRSTAKLENMDRVSEGSGNQAALTSGTIRANPLGVLRAGDTLAGLLYISGTTAGATLTNQWAGIARFNPSGAHTILGISPTDGATAWGASSSKAFVFGTGGTAGAPTTPAPFTADQDELLLAFIMVAGTTVPTLAGITHSITGINNSPVVTGTGQTGQTTPLAVGGTINSLTVGGVMPYVQAT